MARDPPATPRRQVVKSSSTPSSARSRRILKVSIIQKSPASSKTTPAVRKNLPETECNIELLSEEEDQELSSKDKDQELSSEEEDQELSSEEADQDISMNNEDKARDVAITDKDVKHTSLMARRVSKSTKASRAKVAILTSKLEEIQRQTKSLKAKMKRAKSSNSPNSNDKNKTNITNTDSDQTTTMADSEDDPKSDCHHG